ncbi:hypothetical protein PMI42_04825 [Bradyrhizobium sp. YR681]|uniref:hypothetical protein n=1 Tax=Bradyrhizobium sp. YR681 TaxID=1144344 RepID=UPI0002710D1F|nr:hypothetical protein [Bradyrhizobium sp. YR681]EJN11811.1 hypothetical protein PMI42_04825 [Bradyrhizobium sp. YR681]
MRQDPDEVAPLVDARLAEALRQVGQSPLGMPATVDTFRAMLDRAGLALVLKHNPDFRHSGLEPVNMEHDT